VRKATGVTRVREWRGGVIFIGVERALSFEQSGLGRGGFGSLPNMTIRLKADPAS
jgi:hypothetical protein